MYHDNVVEVFDRNTLRTAAHPYTIGLLSSVLIPSPESRSKGIFVIPGEPPSQTTSAIGCVFTPRYPLPTEVCITYELKLIEVCERHKVACHIFDVRYFDDYENYRKSLIKSGGIDVLNSPPCSSYFSPKA